MDGILAATGANNSAWKSNKIHQPGGGSVVDAGGGHRGSRAYDPSMVTSEYVTCPLCEATCGLEVTVVDGRIETVRGDKDDVFSQGYICPKGAALGALHDDPDALRAPLVKRDGSFTEVSWDEAFA